MNNPTLIALVTTSCLVSSYVAVALSTRLETPSHQESSSALTPIPNNEMEDLRAKIERIGQQVSQLSLEAPSGVRSQPVDPESVREMVLAAMAAGPSDGQRDDGESDSAIPGEEPLSVARRLFAEIQKLGLTSEEADLLWKQASETEGGMDALLDCYRDSVEANPQSTEAHLDLARASLEAARLQPNHENGVWWRESDDSFATALDLDPALDNARFEKALNLSFWPAAFGRQAEAVGHFEWLLDNRSSLSDKHHEDTYVWLGNLYVQRGDAEKGLETYQAGLLAYPDSESLSKRVKDADAR